MVVQLSCPRCQAPYKPGTIICGECGFMLEENRAATHRIDGVDAHPRIEWGTKSFSPGGVLTLHVGEDRKLFKVNLLTRTELTIGRTAPDAQPDIDLASFDALSAGVSRLHARLILADGKLYIEDSGSANGTFVNGVRVAKGERRAIVDGNELHLARLKVQIFF